MVDSIGLRIGWSCKVGIGDSLGIVDSIVVGDALDSHLFEYQLSKGIDPCCDQLPHKLHIS